MSEPRVISFPAAQSVSDQAISREAEGDGAAVTLGSSRVGEQLRLAREARNLSLGEAAQSLKLAPRQVEALESENWGALPGNTMIRGFVRNYARLLNLDADVLMRALDAAQLQQAPQLEASAGTSASLPPASSRRVERRDWLAVLAGLLLLGLAGLAYFFIPADLWRAQLTALIESQPAAPSQEIAAPVPVPPPAETAAAKGGAGESVTVIAAPHATVLSDASVATPQPSAALSPPAGSGLKLSFAQPAWIEVRDARGQLVLSELSAAGSQREIAGEPPLSLIIGNSTQVTLQFRGKVIDLAPYTKNGVARLTVE